MTDPDLRRYQRQLDAGFPSLSFEPGLEHEFCEAFQRRNLLRQRSAILLGVSLLCMLAWLDLPMLTPEQQQSYLWTRIYFACPILVLAFCLTFVLQSLIRYFQAVSFILILYIGLITNLLIADTNSIHEVLRYESTSLIIVTCYLLGGMMFRYAVLCTGAVGLSYFMLALIYGAHITPHQVFFVLAHWWVGGVGAYVIEYNARYNFLQRGIMEALAQTDALTGVLNRGAINTRMRHVFEYAAREAKYVTVLLVDVDHFKKYNDFYGHIEGDQCLIKVAHALATCCRRPMDFMGRYGGEEFLILWFDTKPDEAETLKKNVKTCIDALKIPHEASGVIRHVTVSGGMVTGVPSQAGASTAFLRAADDCLYRAKTAGRNEILSRLIQD